MPAPTDVPCTSEEACKEEAIPLRKGVPTLPFSDDVDEKAYYFVSVPSGASNLMVTISGGTGDADLYVRHSNLPTEDTYDCRPFENGNDEMCDIQDLSAGNYYIMIIGKEAYNNLGLVADYNEGSGATPTPAPAPTATPEPAPTATPAPAPTAPPVTGDCQPDTVQQALLDGHNQARATGRNCGSKFYPAVAPLAWSCQLGQAAQAHSDDMATNNYFDHNSQDGSSPFDRIARTGYQSQGAGENIAAGQQSVESAISGWLSSSGHCSNIMGANYTEMGAALGESASSDYKKYWTAVFARPSK